jgi:hypothetical protein
MKKSKTLRLNRETLHKLSGELRGAAAGATAATKCEQATCLVTCAITCIPRLCDATLVCSGHGICGQ